LAEIKKTFEHPFGCFSFFSFPFSGSQCCCCDRLNIILCSADDITTVLTINHVARGRVSKASALFGKLIFVFRPSLKSTPCLIAMRSFAKCLSLNICLDLATLNCAAEEKERSFFFCNWKRSIFLFARSLARNTHDATKQNWVPPPWFKRTPRT
jgi:hypothetical protein